MTKIRLLIAEDNPDHQGLLMLALDERREELDIRLASSAAEFLALVAAGSIDCVVLDFNLGPDRADDLLLRAGPALEGVPVIVISSAADQATAINSFRCGRVVDFVPKHEAARGSALYDSIRDAVRDSRVRANERRQGRRRESELRRLSETDPLTGLLNRRGLQRALDRGADRRASALILFDIDHFKAINDRVGHSGGDTALVGVAKLLQASVGPGDLVARWGGEEFVVLAAAESAARGWGLAERVRSAAHTAGVDAGGTGGRTSLTLSAGVCQLSGPGGPTDPAIATDRADRAMYLAKADGRNRVATWEMARVREVAEEIGSRAGLDPRARRDALLEALAPTLGAVQLQHAGPHGLAVEAMSRMVARRLGLNPIDIELAGLAGLMHDLGKTCVPDAILGKASPLEADERRLIDTHAVQGAAIIEALGLDDRLARAVRDHHRWHSGGPDARVRVPGARCELSEIVAVADAMVAMTTERPYRPAVHVTEAARRLLEQSGSQFEPQAARAAVHAASSVLER